MNQAQIMMDQHFVLFLSASNQNPGAIPRLCPLHYMNEIHLKKQAFQGQTIHMIHPAKERGKPPGNSSTLYLHNPRIPK